MGLNSIKIMGGDVTAPAVPALAASVIANNTQSLLYDIVYTNTNVGTRYLQVFDSATLPADGAVPFVSIQVLTGATYMLSWPLGRKCLNGIVVCNSSTAGTKTIGAADGLFDVNFRRLR